MVKDEAREEGRRLGIPNAEKPDSQELCFVPDGDVRGFVAKERGEARPGRVVSSAGETLATHEGIEGFTIGQRKGLGLGGGPPRYVLRIVSDTSDVMVGPEAGLFSDALSAVDATWTAGRGDEGVAGGFIA